MRTGPVHAYAVHDLIRIRSERRLPELERFRVAPAGAAEPDLVVEVVPDPARAAAPDAVLYREAPGRFGFSLAIERRPERTRALVSPLVGASPHVLYTNVVEPLLRWQLVRGGYALMHGACLAVDGEAVFVTARTDTGKTTTVLNTVRASAGRHAFLSDDMTIFCPDGRVLAYPKPLTISNHTVRAIGGAPLSRAERARLVVQSRLHSKGGRSAGMRLYRMGLPAATLSAIVQWLVPPPKFMVDRLVPGARYGRSAQLGRVVVIERGPDAREALSHAGLVDLLIANAEDAYGFPPYPLLEHDLVHWQGEDLRERERALVASALRSVDGLLVRSSSFGWHEVLLELGRRPARVPGAPAGAAPPATAGPRASGSAPATRRPPLAAQTLENPPRGDETTTLDG